MQRIAILILFFLCAFPAYAGPRMALIAPDGTIARLADNIDPKAGVKPDWKWLPAPVATPPSFDPETQVLIGPTRTVGASQVTESYTVRARTAAELDADKDSKIADIGEAVVRALCNHENRIRALQPSPPAQMSLAQCRAAFKSLLP